MKYYQIALRPEDFARSVHGSIIDDFRAITVANGLVALSYIASETFDDVLPEYFYACIDDSQVLFYLPLIQRYQMTEVPRPTEGWFIFEEGGILAFASENFNEGKDMPE